MPKLVVINTHPIQYFAPLYKAITEDGNFDLEVWYCTKHGLEGEIDKQFGQAITWDIPILEGYNYSFLKNNSWKPSIYTGFFGVLNFEIIKKMWQLPRKSFVVIHGWDKATNILAIILCNLFGLIICLRGESPLKQEMPRSSKQKFIRKIIFQYLLFPLIDKFLYIGENNKRFYEFFGVPKRKLIFTPYSIDNHRFKNSYNELSAQKNILRSNFNIPIDAKVVIFSGKYIQKKRPLDLVEAAGILKDENVFFVLIGDGELRNSVENRIKALGLNEKVLLTGFVNQSEIVKYYALADIFVMCSEEGETWGLSTNEAMNFKLPIIISDMVGNTDDLVKEGINGFTFPKGDYVSLAEKIRILVNDNTFLNQAGETSFHLIQNYSYQNIIKGLLQLKD